MPEPIAGRGRGALPDKRVDAAKAYADTPETGQLNQLFTQFHIASLKAEHCSWSTRHLGMQFVLRVSLQARIVDLELVCLQKVGNLDSIGLLAIHANSQCLDSSHQQPAVKRSKSNSGGVDCEVDFL